MTRPDPNETLTDGWTVASVLLNGDELSFAELRHTDGRVVKMVPQESVARVMAQQDPIGRLIASAIGESFLAFNNPEKVRARQMRNVAETAIDVLRESQLDKQALASVFPEKKP